MAWLGVGEDAGEVAGPIVAGLVWTAWGIPAVLGIRIGIAVAAEVATAYRHPPLRVAHRDRTRQRRPRPARLAAPRGRRRQRQTAASELALDFGAVLEQALATSSPLPPPPRPAKGSTGAHRTRRSGGRRRSRRLARPSAGGGGDRPRARPARRGGAGVRLGRGLTVTPPRATSPAPVDSLRRPFVSSAHPVQATGGACGEEREVAGVSAVHRKYLSIFSPPGSTFSISTS